MAQDPSVSVIIPTYNRALFLPHTIRSVLAQTLLPLEIVIVDDGSTDETESQCRDLSPPVRYVRQPNAGVASARNHGARLAKGDWLAFVDSDDLWHSDKLRVQLTALAAHSQAAWSITGCDVIDPAGAVVQRGIRGVFALFQDLAEEPEAFFSRYFTSDTVVVGASTYQLYVGDAWTPLFLGNFALPSSALVRRELFEHVGRFDAALRLAEETEFFHRLAAASPMVLATAPLVQYRTGQGGSLISPANVPRLIEGALVSLDRALALRPNPTPVARDHYARGKQRLLRNLAFERLSVCDGRGARAALDRAQAAGAPRDLWSVAVWAASWMPPSVLGALHSVKRRLHRGRRP